MPRSLQCDLSHTTFHFDDKLVKVNREPKSVYMIEQNEDDEMTWFVDIDINSFKVGILVLEKN